MDLNSSSPSVIPIQHRLQTPEKSLPEGPQSVWDDMHSWVERRQKEWDAEMAQLKNEFFSLKTATKGGQTPAPLSSRHGSETSLPEGMSTCSSSSKVCDTDRGRVFRLTFDVSQFDPDEVNVRTEGNSLTVRAKHEEKQKTKSISREFNRRVDIPNYVNPQALQCFIQDDGTLMVEAELPSPSYESSSVNRDSPSMLENSSVQSFLSEGASERDICSPSRADPDEMHVYSPPRMDWNVSGNSSRERDHNCFPRDYGNTGYIAGRDKDVYSWQQTDRDLDSFSGINNSHREPVDTSYQTTRGQDLAAKAYGNARNVYQQSGLSSSFSNDQESDLVYSPLQRTLRNGVETGNLFGNGLYTENENLRVLDGIFDPDVFSVVIDVGMDFDPNELAVKTIDRKLVVHARRSNQQFGRHIGGDIYREYDLPQGVEPESISANLTPDGTLIIEAPTNSSWPSVNRSSYPYTS